MSFFRISTSSVFSPSTFLSWSFSLCSALSPEALAPSLNACLPPSMKALRHLCSRLSSTPCCRATLRYRDVLSKGCQHHHRFFIGCALLSLLAHVILQILAYYRRLPGDFLRALPSVASSQAGYVILRSKRTVAPLRALKPDELSIELSSPFPPHGVLLSGLVHEAEEFTSEISLEASERSTASFALLLFLSEIGLS